MITEPEPVVSETVSIIIPTFNHACYLADAIKSALSQSTTPAEIIVVDDGSTDNPAAVVADFPGIHLIAQSNQGLAAARNTGLRAATGRYLVFLDADDRLLPQAIEINLARFAAHPDCGLVYAAYRMVNEAGESLQPVPLRRTGADPYATLLEGNCIGMHATVMYRRDRLEEVGGFNRDFKACEDYDVYLRIAQRFPIACGPECVADYRLHNSNMSRNLPIMLEAALAVLARQAAHARSSPKWRTAYERGISYWKTYYAAEQLRQVRKAVMARTISGHLVRQTAAMVRLAPQALSRVATKAALRQWRERQGKRPVNMGGLRRTTPISIAFGYDRGKPLDRRYVEHFLARHAADIRGRVLEIGDNSYTVRFGGRQVEQSDVLNRYAGHPQTTFIGDIADRDALPADTFDCIILTQTLHLVFDMAEALATLHRALRPGGVLLVTVPWASPIDRGEWGESWYWSLTPAALSRLLDARFTAGRVSVTSYGNVLSATAFLQGLAEHELTAEELDVHDPFCPVVVAGRAERASLASEA